MKPLAKIEQFIKVRCFNGCLVARFVVISGSPFSFVQRWGIQKMEHLDVTIDEKKEAKAKETQPATGSEQQNNNQATTVEDLPDQTDAIDARGLQPDFATRFSPVNVVIISLLVALLIASILLNGSFLLQDKGGDEPAIGPVHWLLAAGLILVSFISLASAFWANHARSIYLKDGPALVPEKWGLILVELTEFFKLQHTRSQASLASLQDSTKAQAQKANDLLESFLTLQQALSDRDAEIARLKKGYDAKIFKRFLQRFIRVDRSLAEMEQDFLDPEHAKNYRFLKRIMEDALEECGVEKFIPELGFDYREAGPQIGEDPNEIQTEDEKQDFRIARVDTAGYVLKGEGDLEVIVPSKVTIFRMGPSKDEDK